VPAAWSLETIVTELGSFVRRQPDEVWGWALLVAALLAALGIHFDLLGMAGRELREVGTSGLGWGEDVLPAALLAGGIGLIAGRARRGVAGVAVSVVVLALAAASLADLAAGHPSWHDTRRVLGGAGGVVGAVAGAGLHLLLGDVGAAILVGACALGACCALVGVRLRAAVIGAGRGAIACWRVALGLLEHHGAPADASAGTTRGSPPARAAAGNRQGPPRMLLGAFDDDLDVPGRPQPAGTAGEEEGRAVSVDGATPAGNDGTSEDTLVRDAGAVAGGGGGDALPGDDDADAEAADGAAAGSGGRVSAARRAVAAAGMLAEATDADGTTGAEQLSLGILPSGTPWRLPPPKLLRRSRAQDLDRAAIEERGRVLERALAAHGVETHLVGYTVGPTVTRFELELGAGVKVARVTSLHRDIAYAMASADVRILAPIPGRSAIGVEVPNHDRQLVTLGDVLAAAEARRATHPLDVALGRDIAGRAVMVNLAEMPHLLIAGATGAGKSSCINSLITSILMRSTPEHVRLILIDPKRVELGQYNGLPHLLTPVVIQPKRAANALSWAVAEMERRYDVLAEVGMRDITGYNAAVDRGDFIEPPLVPGLHGDDDGDDVHHGGDRHGGDASRADDSDGDDSHGDGSRDDASRDENRTGDDGNGDAANGDGANGDGANGDDGNGDDPTGDNSRGNDGNGNGSLTRRTAGNGDGGAAAVAAGTTPSGSSASDAGEGRGGDLVAVSGGGGALRSPPAADPAGTPVASSRTAADDPGGDTLAGTRPATGTGAAAAPHSRYQRLPFVLVVVDELNDLMMVAARDVEESICRIAQMARAVGIHLVIATQRPSVDVITGVIKANVPSRLAFSVSSLADSRVILDQPGAERLIGRGDLLLLTASSSVPRRLQGPWVSEEEVRAVVAHWRRQSSPRYIEGVVGDDESATIGGSGPDDDDDELLQQALELVVRMQLGSTSMLQRKLRVGFARAGRLMDLLERRGVVGPSEGSKARAVLMTPDELDERRP
jgi:hypothetical protein